MFRISFRKVMLAGFILIMLLLGGMAVRSWLVVERFVEQSRQGSEQALQLTALIQEIGESTVDLERSARQFIVLGDPAVRERFEANLARSLAVLDRLDLLAVTPLSPLLDDWRKTADTLKTGLEQGMQTDGVAPLLARLVRLNQSMKQLAQHWLEDQSGRVLGDLEDNRLQLGAQLAMALAGALLVAMILGWWLMRPMRHLERSIIRLGEKRFDEPIVVGGPADLRQLGRQLDWLRQRLAELEAEREQMLRHVSHELKTPLTALREGVALLSEEVPGALGDAQREVVEILQHNVIALQQQIEGLLSLNAAAFGARRLDYRLLALADLMAEVVRRRELHAQGRRLLIGIEAQEVMVRSDGEKLAVILDNLLSNAIDFSPEGGEILLRASRSAEAFKLECIDRGPGVAPEDAEKIFEPFVQGSQQAPMPRQGSGVGLSIVRELVRAMGGTVRLVASEQGAHFCVEIPNEK